MSCEFSCYGCVTSRQLPEKIGDVLTAEQYRAVEELGILVDKDDQVRGRCRQRPKRVYMIRRSTHREFPSTLHTMC